MCILLPLRACLFRSAVSWLLAVLLLLFKFEFEFEEEDAVCKLLSEEAEEEDCTLHALKDNLLGPRAVSM